MQEKANILVARFPFGACDHPDTTDWLVETVLKMKADPRVGELLHWRIDDTPITMGRNRCLRKAQQAAADLLLMIDSDMRPDLPGPGAKPFWDSSFDFWWRERHRGPLVVAAPYCGPPPEENVYVFQWGRRQSDHPNADLSLDQFRREQAAERAGFEEVAALPTGLILIDVRALDALKPPWCAYEWADEYQDQKGSTEDVFFTRNLSLAGVRCFCNWDAWAGHWKRKCVGRPTKLTADDVREQFREALLSGRRRGERLTFVRPGRLAAAAPAPEPPPEEGNGNGEAPPPEGPAPPVEAPGGPQPDPAGRRILVRPTPGGERPR